jgi:hypothetical protein
VHGKRLVLWQLRHPPRYFLNLITSIGAHKQPGQGQTIRASVHTRTQVVPGGGGQGGGWVGGWVGGWWWWCVHTPTLTFTPVSVQTPPTARTARTCSASAQQVSMQRWTSTNTGGPADTALTHVRHAQPSRKTENRGRKTDQKTPGWLRTPACAPQAHTASARRPQRVETVQANHWR